MKKLLYILPLIMLMFFSCTKDQRALNELEGNWNLSERRITNVNTQQNDITYPYQTNWSFTKCNLSKDTFCPGSISDTTGTSTFHYSVTEDGYKVNFTFYSTDTTSSVYDLVSFGGNEMQLSLQTADSTVYALKFFKL